MHQLWSAIPVPSVMVSHSCVISYGQPFLCHQFWSAIPVQSALCNCRPIFHLLRRYALPGTFQHDISCLVLLAQLYTVSGKKPATVYCHPLHWQRGSWYVVTNGRTRLVLSILVYLEQAGSSWEGPGQIVCTDRKLAAPTLEV